MGDWHTATLCAPSFFCQAPDTMFLTWADCFSSSTIRSTVSGMNSMLVGLAGRSRKQRRKSVVRLGE